MSARGCQDLILPFYAGQGFILQPMLGRAFLPRVGHTLTRWSRLLFPVFLVFCVPVVEGSCSYMRDLFRCVSSLVCCVPLLFRCCSATFRRCPVACLPLFWCCSAAFRRLACSCSVAVLSLYCYVTPRSAVIPLSYCVFPDLTVSCRWPPLIAPFDICRRAGYSVRSITT